MRVLVTGSSGFIGKHVVEELKRRKHDVFEYDKAKGCSYDILDKAQIDEAIRRAQVVIHLAGISRVKHGEANPIECMRVNLVGTMTILECIAGMKRKPKLLFVSSRDTCMLGNASIYTYSKRWAENICAYYQFKKGIDVKIIHMLDVMPPSDSDKAANVIGRKAKANEDIHLTNSNQVFKLIPVQVAAKWIVDSIDKTVSEPHSHLITLRQLAEWAIAMHNSTSKIVEDK